MSVTSLDLDAIVLADDPLASVRIAGLSARERAIRVSRKVGAARVLVVETAADREGLTAWRADRTCPVLVIRADQLVHTPLVAPLVAALTALAEDGAAIAVGPDDADAGAYLATGASARAALSALEMGSDPQLSEIRPALRVPHGDVARHAIATAEDRAGAHRMLYSLLIKPQDNAISRYVFRPLARRLSMVLVHTPITPNMLSLTVAVMIAISCVLTATANWNLVVLGAAIQASSGYIDCCDGEVARLKLMSSRFGAWLDTIVDELSTIAYMIAVGWNCHLMFGHPGWDVWTAGIAVGVATYGWSLYCIYFNIIVGVGSANSQDYAAKFEVVPAAGGAVRIRPVPKQPLITAKPLPPGLDALAKFAPNFVRRDFIVWCALLFAVLHWTHACFVVHLTGGVVSALIVTKDHVHLRRLRRSVARAGQRLLAPTS